MFTRRRRKYLYKKYKDFQFSMIKECKASKRNIWYKMSGKKLQKIIFCRK